MHEWRHGDDIGRRSVRSPADRRLRVGPSRFMETSCGASSFSEAAASFSLATTHCCGFLAASACASVTTSVGEMRGQHFDLPHHRSRAHLQGSVCGAAARDVSWRHRASLPPLSEHLVWPSPRPFASHPQPPSSQTINTHKVWSTYCLGALFAVELQSNKGLPVR